MTNNSRPRASRSALALGILVAAAWASDAAVMAEEATELSPIVVVATKTPRPLAEVAGTVTIIDAAAIADQLSGNIADLIRYEPAISAPRPTSRFGHSGYTLRGIGGNRVAIEIDGVPVADRFAIGNFSNSGRDLVDVNLIERVEILRGPASTLYGSDAIGGVVSYFTHDPEDLVSANGQPYFGFSSGYLGADESGFATVRAAWAQPTYGGVASFTYRNGHQLQAAAGDGADRQDYDSLSGFAKLSWHPGADARLTASLDHFERDALTDVRSVLGSGRFSSTTLLNGDDSHSRDRLSLSFDVRPSAVWAEEVRLLAYGQRVEADQFTVEERAARDLRRQRDFRFTQEVLGFEADVSSAFYWGKSHHRIGYGVALAQTDTRELRDALQTDLGGGSATRVVLGEHFPVRDFPNSRSMEAGLYVHDEVIFGDSRWTWIPALRWDYYDLSPRLDAIYRADNPATEVVSVSEQNLSPKLGFTYDFANRWSAFGQYAHGFRAPPFEDANIGLDIPLFNIRAIPNPQLKSESSQGLELGLRYYQAGTSVSVAAHYTDYADFIETKTRLGTDPETGVILFQSRNLERTHIYGAELRLEQEFGAFSETLAPFDFSIALAWTRGEDQQTGAELASVDPAQAVAALRWQVPERPLSATLTATVTDRKRGLDDSPAEQFQPPGYGIVDLTANYRIRAQISLRAGLFNITNKTYWRWSDVQGLGTGDPLLPVLANPGRYAAASLSLNW